MKIKDFCTINPKVLKNFDNNLLVSFVPMANVSEDGHINTNDVRKYEEVKKGFTYFENGDVLLAKITPCLENGKGAVARNLKNNIGFGSTEFHVFRPDNSKVLSEWLYYFTHWENFRKNCENNMSGSAGQKRVSKSYLENYEIELPDLIIQKKTVNILDQINNLISLRTQQLEQLDLLIKSRFVEMFGDPVKNEKGWNLSFLNDICESIVDCPHSTPNYTDNNTGFMCVRTSFIKKNQILWDKLEYISEEEFYYRIQRRKPSKGDIIYTREGAILGIAAIINKDCNIALGQRCMLLSPNKAKCQSEFLCRAMNFETFLDKALKGKIGSASPHINVADIKSFPLILPPLALQTQFAAFVEEVDKTKATVKQSLEWLNTLKAKLMQDYFG